MKYYSFIIKLHELADSKKIKYAWGMLGQPLTYDNVKQKAEQYPSWYTPKRINHLLSEPKHFGPKHFGMDFGMDCSGMIKSVLWGFNFNDKANLGGASYRKNGIPDLNSSSLIGVCRNVSRDFSDIQIGALVYMKGHVGIYVGDNTVIECTNKWEGGVLLSGLGNRDSSYKGKSRQWESWGLLPFIDYTGPSINKSFDELMVGDKVEVINKRQADKKHYGKTYTGGEFRLWFDTYQIMEIRGDRVVIGYDGVVTSAVNMSNIRRVKK